MRKPTKRTYRVPLLSILGTFALATSVTARAIAADQVQPSALQRADQLAHAGHTEEAVTLLQADLGARPTDLEARLALALVLAQQHKYKEARANVVLVPVPTAPEARVRYFRLVASIDSGLGDSTAAAHAMEDALRAAPSDEQLQLITGFAEAEAGEWKACIRNVAPLYKQHPNPRSGLLLLRAELASHADFARTLESLRTLNLPPDQELQVSAQAAELLASADRHLEAIDELQQALKLAGPADEILLYNLAVEQYGARQFDQAFATLTSLRSQNDSAEIEDLLGDVEEQRGDRAAAVHSHESAIAMAPREEHLRLSLGAELLKYQEYQAAVSVFQQAAELFPSSARIYVGLGMAFYFTEKYEDSVSAFLHADQLDSGGGRALNYLGATQVDNPAGPTPAALEAICVRAKTPKAEPAVVTWCSALLLRKAYLADDRAAGPDIIRRLRLAVKLEPGDPVATCSLGQALEWTQQFAEARHWLEICVRLRPNSTEAHYRLSRVYLALGLKHAAAEQTALVDTTSAERDRQQSMTNTFADEMLTPIETIPGQK
jgi:tetratricopeptide (TPR) repeat protein